MGGGALPWAGELFNSWFRVIATTSLHKWSKTGNKVLVPGFFFIFLTGRILQYTLGREMGLKPNTVNHSFLFLLPTKNSINTRSKLIPTLK